MNLATIACAACVTLAVSIPRQSFAETLYAVTSEFGEFGAYLRTVDPATGATLTSTAIALSTGDPLQSAHGLATDPSTQTLFVVLQRTGTPRTTRVLATLEPSGAATYVGELGDAFAGLAVDASGTLYGVTGDGGATPEHLFTIDTATAVATPLMALGNGDDGESIAHHPGDGMLYHMSGYTDYAYEKVDPSAMIVTNIPLSGDAHSEATALVYSTAGVFLMCDLNGVLYRVSDSGAVTQVGGPVNALVKGLAFGPAPVAVVDANWAATKAAYR